MKQSSTTPGWSSLNCVFKQREPSKIPIFELFIMEDCKIMQHHHYLTSSCSWISRYQLSESSCFYTSATRTVWDGSDAGGYILWGDMRLSWLNCNIQALNPNSYQRTSFNNKSWFNKWTRIRKGKPEFMMACTKLLLISTILIQIEPLLLPSGSQGSRYLIKLELLLIPKCPDLVKFVKRQIHVW